MSAGIDRPASSSSWYARTCWKTIAKCAGSLTDQSLVSGTRFLTTILIGSFCGAAELGSYALGFSILMALQAIQISLISRPYTILGSQRSGREREGLAGSGLLHFLGFGLLTFVSLAVVAGVLSAVGIGSSLAPIFMTLSIGAPFILLREHARQFCFSHLNVATATVVDFTATVIQVVGLCWLAWTEQLTFVSAYVTMAIACGIAGLVWLGMDRNKIRLERSRVLSDFRRQWSIGKWDCASELTFAVQAYGVTWLLVLMLDNSSVGIYAACMTVLQLMNPFLLGTNSVLVPKTARAFAARGVAGMHSIVRMTTLVFAVVTTVFAALAIVWGTDVLEFLYRGQGFEIPVAVVAVLACGSIVEVIAMGPENGLWAMERHDFNFRVSIIGFMATFGSALVLISPFGLTGAAVSFFIARFAAAVAHWLAYHFATLDLNDSASTPTQSPACSS